jgi:plastin-1
MWLNSMPGMEDVHCTDLTNDMEDGLVLIRAFKIMEPGCVDEKKYEHTPKNKFMKVANCNYVVKCGNELKFSLVGIGGNDIHEGNHKLILALMWQMMRHDVIKHLKGVDEAGICQWANQRVSACEKDEAATNGAKHAMESLKDPSLSNCLFYLDILHAMEPRAIDWSIVTAGESEDEKCTNAKYCISVARKLGSSVICVWEDLVDRKPKMIFGLLGFLMVHDHLLLQETNPAVQAAEGAK